MMKFNIIQEKTNLPYALKRSNIHSSIPLGYLSLIKLGLDKITVSSKKNNNLIPLGNPLGDYFSNIPKTKQLVYPLSPMGSGSGQIFHRNRILGLCPKIVQNSSVASSKNKPKFPSVKNSNYSALSQNMMPQAYLQFLLYQDLKKTHVTTTLKGQDREVLYKDLSKGDNRGIPPRGMEDAQSSKNLLPNNSINSGTNLSSPLGGDRFLNILSSPNKKWGSFFPYRKSFICYWLLPLVGFVSYLSNNNLHLYYTPQGIKLSPCFKTNNGVLLNILNTNTNTITPEFQNNFALLNKQEVKPLIDSNFSSFFLFKQIAKKQNLVTLYHIQSPFWYQTTILGELPLNSKSVLPMATFSFLPLSSSRGYPPRGDAFILASNINTVDTIFSGDGLKGKMGNATKYYGLPLNPPPREYPPRGMLNVPTNNSLVEEAIKNTNLNSILSQYSENKLLLFKQKFNNSNSTNKEFLEESPERDKSKLTKQLYKKLLNSSYTFSNNHYPLGYHLWGYPKEDKNKKAQSQINGSLNNYLLGISPLGHKEKQNHKISITKTTNKRLKNILLGDAICPVGQYKKASYILDSFFKEIPENNSIPLFATYPSFDSKLGGRQQRGMILKSLSKDSLNKIIENNKLIAYGFKESFFQVNSLKNLITPLSKSPHIRKGDSLYFRTTKSFTKKNGDYPPGGDKNKYMYLEEIIQRIGSKTTTASSTISNTVVESQDNYLNLKITKDQIYTLILNSLKNQINSVMEFDVGGKKTNNEITNHPPRGIKLNHPLLFSTIKNTSFNSNMLITNHDSNPVEDNITPTNNSFLLTQNSHVTNYFSKVPNTSTENITYPPRGDNSKGMLKGSSNLEEKPQVALATKISKNQSFINLNNKYIHFISMKFKEIVKPFYPSIPIGDSTGEGEDMSTYLVNSNTQLTDKQQLMSPLSSPFMLASPLREKANIVEGYKEAKRIALTKKKGNIYLILRSYLSKKQLINKKTKMKKILKKQSLNLVINEIQNKNYSLFSKPLYPLKGSTKKLISKTKKTNTYSTNSLFKNRIFILKSNQSTFNYYPLISKVDVTPFIPKEDFIPKGNERGKGKGYFKKLEKRKYNQKKHRRKKQRKETRHRKKRKRFYPRATWSRYKMYTNLLKFIKYKPKISVNDKSSLILNNPFKALLGNDSKDFYQIKQSVLAELKRSFWKSYWLRSNLKPYLNNIKLYLKEIEKSSTKETLSFGLNNLITYLSGLNLPVKNLSLDQDQMDNTVFKEVNTYTSEFQDIFSANGSKVKTNYSSSSLTNVLFINNFSADSTNLSFYSPFYRGIYSPEGYTNIINKWQLITQIHEHNRIMYERIQNLILNIRENLTLNGQFKARPNKNSEKLRTLSSLKQNYSSDANNPQGNPDFWVKLSKAISSFFTQSSIKYNGDFVNYRIYWAINKTNLGTFKTINQVKSLWMNTKKRDQSKANKTKKIFYNLQKYFGLTFGDNPLGIDLPLSSSKFSLINTTNDKIGNLSEAKNEKRILLIPKELIESNVQDAKIINYDNTKKIQLALQLAEHKLRQKEQKYLYLGFLPNNISESYWLGLKKPDWSKQYTSAGKSFLEKISLLGIPQRGMESFTLLPGYYKNFSNEINYWWDASKLQFIPTFDNEFCNVFSLRLGTAYSSIPFFPQRETISLYKPTLKGRLTKIPFGDKREIGVRSPLEIKGDIRFPYRMPNKSDNRGYKENSKLTAITFLFHFCSIISLISISQIRDFISFNLIVLSKVSKIYLNLIYSSFNLCIQFTKNLSGLWPNTNSPLGHTPGGDNPLGGIIPLGDKGGIIANSKQKVPYTYKGLKFALRNKLLVQNIYMQKKSSPEVTNIKRDKLSLFIFPPKNKQDKSTFNTKTNYNFSIKTKILNTWYSILFYSSMNALSFSVANISFLTYSYFLKSLNFVETFVRSIYTFFEKPGELIIDWMAYFFLVEWSSDLTNTIPDTIDTNFSNYLTKSLKVQRFPTFAFTDVMTQVVSSYGLLNMPPMYNSIIFNGLPFEFLTGGLLQRRILSIYLLEALNITCRPDTDLLVRQQKGFVFWDIWSDLFINVAEDSNINISELSNLKEEQNKLLEKLIESQTSLPKSKNKLSLWSNRNSKLISLKGDKDKMIGNNISSTASFFIGKTLKNQDLPNMITLYTTGFAQTTSLDSKINRVTNNLSKNLVKTVSWSSSQFLSYQGKDTELFIDLHPPKSFSHVTSIKYSESINQPIGLVLCQVFSGIFYKQVAKNLLVVGPQGDEKSLLIQAIAGETELKIITDNAHRYAMVFRGVAVGIKLLRDVFEALTLHTPCIFLLEDIHAIGERRPFLISDDYQDIEASIYQDKDYALQGNEKNQVIYQLTKHMVSHYKKPYKGDFSLLIPTNHFCFDLFNTQNTSDSTPKRRQKSNLTSLSPLPLTNKDTMSSNNLELNKKDQGAFGKNNLILASSIQLPKNQLLAPPATSPFSVLVLKEEKKFKPKKLVKEYPWSGLPYEQYSNIAKATYSIRVKVALLADMVLSNLSVKLDMITDLLVIIDSVKGNRGFVVFATTHIPYILDPALRRPGRFDETLSLPKIPNLLSRWQICKYNVNLWHYKSGHYSNFTKHKKESYITPLVNATSTLNFGNAVASTYPIGISLNLWESNAIYSHATKASARGKNNNTLGFTISKSYAPRGMAYFSTPLGGCNSPDYPLWGSYFASPLREEAKKGAKKIIPLNSIGSIKQHPFKMQKHNKKSTVLTLRVYNLVSKIFLLLHLSLGKTNTSISLKGDKSLLMNKWGDFVFSLSLVEAKNSFSTGGNSIYANTLNKFLSKDSLVYTSLYSSPNIFKQHLTILMAGQLGYLFSSPFIKNSASLGGLNTSFPIPLGGSPLGQKGSPINSNPLEFLIGKEKEEGAFNKLTIFDNTWRTASSLVYSFVQKRWIYNLNNSLFDFGLEGYKTEIPSPPSSNILLPAKRYENYKRTFIYSKLKRKTNTSISDTILIHQQQRLVKRLYKIPLKEYFRSEILTNLNLFGSPFIPQGEKGKQNFNTNNTNTQKNNNFSSFSNASIILAPLENLQQKPTSINWFFRQRIYNRHRSYLSNQWWNGQLQEHNTESTFLSDIDWRYTISSSLPDQKQGSIGDLFIDFPDSEQYYNPKNQRWVNTSGSWNSWFDFHKASMQEYSSHYMFECITTAYKCLDKNRELLDYYVIHILEKGITYISLDDEILLLEIFKRIG